MALIEKLITKLASLQFFTIINPDEAGVHIRLGRHFRTLGQGFYWQLPIVDSIETIQVKVQSVNTLAQHCMSKDGESVAVSSVIRYEISDAYKALYEVQNYDDQLIDVTMTALAEYISNIPLRKQFVFGDVKEFILSTVDDLFTNGDKEFRFTGRKHFSDFMHRRADAYELASTGKQDTATLAEINAEIQESLGIEAQEWGIDIVEFKITDLAPCLVLRQMK